MSTANSEQDIWSTLRDYCEHGQSQDYSPLTDEQARELEGHGIYLPPKMRQQFTFASSADGMIHGMMKRPQIVCYPPATEEQLRATEEQLGCPLPPDLCRLYAEVANGGINLGPVQVFHGAIGGCGEYADTRSDGQTIEELMSESDWEIHPRIEEALLRYPGRYVIVHDFPHGFTWIGVDSELGVSINMKTGRIYISDYWGEIPDAPGDDSSPNILQTLQVVAPSLSVWFERWLDKSRGEPSIDHGELLPEMVETDDLPDPEIVWRGLYRSGPDRKLRQDNTDNDGSDEIP